MLLNMIYRMHPVALWVLAILGYSAITALFGLDFSLQPIISLSAMVFFIVFSRRYRQQYIEDPVLYIVFDDINMSVGLATLPITSIRQVALDTVKNEGYFSLPLNHSLPGVVPEFIFPAAKIDELTNHLKKNLPDSVVFIR